MIITYFTPVAAESATARSSAATVAALRSDGHDVVVVGSHEHWPPERCVGFDDAIPWRERHRIEPRVPISDLVVHEVSADESESMGAAVWIPYTRGLVAVDGDRRPPGVGEALDRADLVVARRAIGGSVSSPTAVGLAPVVDSLPALAEPAGTGSAVATRHRLTPATGSNTGAAGEAPAGLFVSDDGSGRDTELVMVAVASVPAARDGVDVASSVSDAFTTARLGRLAENLGVTFRAGQTEGAPGWRTVFVEEPLAAPSTLPSGLIDAAANGIASIVVGRFARGTLPSTALCLRADPANPMAGLVSGLRIIADGGGALLVGTAPGALTKVVTPEYQATWLVAAGREAARRRPLRELDEAFISLRTAAAATRAHYESDTASLRR